MLGIRRAGGVAVATLLVSCSGGALPNARAQLQQHTVEIDGHPFAVWEKSPPNSVGTIVLLHGRTWSALPDFDLQAPGEELSLMDGLVERGYATYAPDMRGYGKTPRDSSGWLTPDRAVKDMIGILEWLIARTGGGERPVLLGWSNGSTIAHLAIQRRPDLVSSLMLFGYWRDLSTEMVSPEYPAEPDRRATTAEAAASDFITEGSISQAAVDAYVAAALAADPVRTDWKGLEQWNELDASLITVPTLLLQGVFDPIAPTDRQATLFTNLATDDREWVVIPGGDHAAFLETPRAYFIDAVVNFMERPRD
jgi:pimeloyl-ACP methyl ester carboxylesterase